MPVELNRHTETILCAAVEINDPGERTAYLDDACGDDAVLRRDVQRMVDDHFRAGLFLERPGLPLPATIFQPLLECPGTQIGRYKLLEQIGEGGMGVVYVAEQTEPVRRRVALKIIKPGMDTRQVVARFEAERQALAMMDHPNIARVHDGGATDTGRPYFVMELVRGMPITEYCDQARLNPRGRLALFMTVCHAVQHAHQKGIIHRDLKPTNVLVTMQDGQPVVKVIDFGVAKAVNQSLTERTVYTAFTELIGTPLYMSPEQAELTSLDVDTRSDVYSLGVLLYELLTGQTPFDRDTLADAGLDEIRRMIREDEPPRPSHRISTLKAEAGSTVSQKRGIDRRQLTRTLTGELDWIVMKALEKDRNRRYESASAFAADIDRHLHNEPVEAGPPSALYRFRKFARRRRGALLGMGLVAISVLGGVGATLWQAAEANTARRQAEANYGIARQAVDDMYVQIAEKWLADEPKLHPIQREFLQKALGFYQNAALREADSFDVQTEIADAYRRVGELQIKLGDESASERAIDEAIRRYESLLQQSANNIELRSGLAKSFNLRGQVKGGRLVSDKDSLRALERAAELAEQVAIEKPDAVEHQEQAVDSLVKLARHHAYDDSRAEGDKAFLRAVERSRDALKRFPDQWRIRALHASACNTYAEILGDVNQRPEPAAQYAREAIDHAREVLAHNERSVLARQALAESSERLARVLPAQSAIPLLSESITNRSTLSSDFPEHAAHIFDLGRAYEQRGIAQFALRDMRSAKKDMLEAVRHQTKAWETDPNAGYPGIFLLGALRNLSDIHQALGEMEEAENISRRREELFQQMVDAPVAEGADGHVRRGVFLMRVGKLDDAVADLTRAIQLDPQNARAYQFRADTLYSLGRHDEELSDYSKLCELQPRNALAHLGRARALYLLSRPAEALVSADRSIELDPDHAPSYQRRAWIFSSIGRQGQALADWQKAVNLGWSESYIGLAMFLSDSGTEASLRDPQEAIRLGKRAVELAETVQGQYALYPALAALGQAYYRAGDYEKAKATLERNIVPDNRGGHANDFLLLAMTCWQLGDKDAANGWFERAVEWLEKNPLNGPAPAIDRKLAEAAHLLGRESDGKRKDASP